VFRSFVERFILKHIKTRSLVAPPPPHVLVNYQTISCFFLLKASLVMMCYSYCLQILREEGHNSIKCSNQYSASQERVEDLVEGFHPKANLRVKFLNNDQGKGEVFT
jgi:hypothetical protein